MARVHAPFQETGAEHSPFLLTGGGGGGLTLAEVLEILAGVKEPKSIQKAALSEEINELLGKGGPPSGPAGGALAGTYPNPSLAAEAVATAAIKLLAITTALLGEESVTTAKIKLLAITSALIANGAVIAEKLGNQAVTTAAIKLLAITEALLAEESVSKKKLTASLQAELVSPLVWTNVETVSEKLEQTIAIQVAVFNGIVFMRGKGKVITTEIPTKSVIFTVPLAARPAAERVLTISTAATTTQELLIKATGEVETTALLAVGKIPNFDLVYAL